MSARQHALDIFMAGVAAADPSACVERHLAKVAEPNLIIAIGKAAIGMARPAMQRFPTAKALVVTNYENAVPLANATVFPAGHPIPDEGGIKASQAVIEALANARGDILALISGGGSALLPAPAGDLTLADKQAVSTLLLGAGLDIGAMNLIRQQLSDLKGGGFLRHAAPNRVNAMLLSDVVGNDLAAIASGPTVHPLGNAADAARLIRDADLWDALPERVKAHLEKPDQSVPDLVANNILLASNEQSVAAMASKAGAAHVIPAPVVGDVGQAARDICDASRPGITLWGGETTVVLKGSGKGGRNQELALRIALEAKARGWQDFVCLQGGSDGRDGPTDAAGGLVDAGTLGRIEGLDTLLANNDSYAALQQAGDLLVTGSTGTNVADLGVMIRR